MRLIAGMEPRITSRMDLARFLHFTVLYWRHGGGFSVNAAVRINEEDRTGLERLLRYSTLSHDSFYLPRPCGRALDQYLPVNG